MPIAVDDIALDQYVTVHSERLDAPPIAETMSLPPEVVHLLSTIGSDRTLHGAVMRVVAIALPYVYCKHVIPAKREKPLVVLDVRDVRLMTIEPSMVEFLRAATPSEPSGPEPPIPEPPGHAPAFPDIPF